MRTLLCVVAPLLVVSLPAAAQQQGFQDPLLDRLAGNWVMKGTIAGAETTHDIAAEWVLDHQYLRFHDVSHEKGSGDVPEYEAIVFIGWDQSSAQYACLWLDSTGGGGLDVDAQVIGHAKPDGDELAFLFELNDGGIIHTTFKYNREADTWQWLVDVEEGEEFRSFARVVLTRR